MNEHLHTFANTIQAPEGFTRESGTGYHDGIGPYRGNDDVYVLLSREDIRIAFNIYFSESIQVSGHTLFKNANGHWLSFSRRGIDDSFYGNDKTDWATMIAAQIQRAAKGKEQDLDVVAVPGLSGIRVHKDTVAKAKEALAARKGWTFTPAGMGTGYRVTKTRPRWGEKAPVALERFLGVSGLWIERLDCD